MFGYTVPLYPRLSARDLTVYRRYYCETCHQLKAGYGLMATATVNYDMTFNTLILNAAAGDVLEFGGTKRSPLCVFGRPRADSALLREMAGYTVLLTKWELYDDRIDKPSLKSNLISVALGRAIAQAETDYPAYDEAVGAGFRALHEQELLECTDAIAMGEAFGRALAAPLGQIAGPADSPALHTLFTELTAAVYVMDALDDLESDYRDDTYNPFLRACPHFINRDDYLAHHLYEVAATVNDVMGRLQRAYADVRPQLRTATGITDNIVYFGVPDAAQQALSGRSTARASVKNAIDGSRARNRTAH